MLLQSWKCYAHIIENTMNRFVKYLDNFSTWCNIRYLVKTCYFSSWWWTCAVCCWTSFSWACLIQERVIFTMLQIIRVSGINRNLLRNIVCTPTFCLILHAFGKEFWKLLFSMCNFFLNVKITAFTLYYNMHHFLYPCHFFNIYTSWIHIMQFCQPLWIHN